jgi:hypothetical protein
MEEKEVMANFKVLSYDFPGEKEENHKKYQLG